MLANKKFSIRIIVASFEQVLHTTYSIKRIRGEWFELDVDVVEARHV